MSERMVAYVDGFNLYHGIHDWAGCRWLWLDLVALARSLRPKSRLVKVHYFTAPVLHDAEAASRQLTYQRALEARHPELIKIHHGRYQTKTHECWGCGRTRRTYEEKETDVSIAVNIVADAARGDADAALLISADSDLIPAVTTARSLNPDQFFVAAFPPERASDEVRRVLPASFTIGKKKIRSAQLPEVVRDGSRGLEHKRPAKWGPTF